MFDRRKQFIMENELSRLLQGMHLVLWQCYFTFCVLFFFLFCSFVFGAFFLLLFVFCIVCPVPFSQLVLFCIFSSIPSLHSDCLHPSKTKFSPRKRSPCPNFRFILLMWPRPFCQKPRPNISVKSDHRLGC